jgi:hypothetical protein
MMTIDDDEPVAVEVTLGNIQVVRMDNSTWTVHLYSVPLEDGVEVIELGMVKNIVANSWFKAAEIFFRELGDTVLPIVAAPYN